MEAIQTQAESPTFEAIRAILKEVAELQKETDKKIGKLGDRFGEMVEYMVMPNLVKKIP